MPPTDFSFVKPEGWELMEPEFEKAEKKLQDKVKRRELSEDMAKKLTDLMWDKYDRWSSGRGKSEKEDQSVLQRRSMATGMIREARIGRVQLIEILNNITRGVIQNPAVFQQTLELNRISDQEFFDLFADDAFRYHQLYPPPLIAYFDELFDSWGYGREMRSVTERSRAARAPKVEAPRAEVPKPKPEAPPEAKPERRRREEPTEVEIKEQRLQPEPSPPPQGLEPPPPSKTGPFYRWHLRYMRKDDPAPKAMVLEGLNPDDALAYTMKLRGLGYVVARPMVVSEVGEVAERPARPQPPAPAKPKPMGAIEAPDPQDPGRYAWTIRYRTPSGVESTISPVQTGREIAAMLRRMEQMGIEVLEMSKRQASASATTRTAQAEKSPVDERFKNGTPVIFLSDADLEFDALGARGQIKENMTGKIKRVEDDHFLVDIAGQLYRVPKDVAQNVMDVFIAQVVVDDAEESPSAPQASPDAGQTAPAPAAQAPVPPGPIPNLDLSRAPEPEPQAQRADGSIGKIVVADLEVEAARMTNREVAAAFASGATSGKSKSMFIDGDTVYSYGRHFPIATWADGNQVYLTTKGYSVTTSIHKGLVHSALAMAGVRVIHSSQVSGGKVMPPSEEDVAAAEKDEARRQRREQKRKEEFRRQVEKPPFGRGREYSEEEVQKQVKELEPPSVPTWGVTIPATPEAIPALTKEQWEARIGDLEDQLLRETDPDRRERLRQRIERMRQAAVSGKIKVADMDIGHVASNIFALLDEMSEFGKAEGRGESLAINVDALYEIAAENEGGDTRGLRDAVIKALEHLRQRGIVVRTVNPNSGAVAVGYPAAYWKDTPGPFVLDPLEGIEVVDPDEKIDKLLTQWEQAAPEERGGIEMKIRELSASGSISWARDGDAVSIVSRVVVANDPLKKIIEINGVKIGIEWPKGSIRTWDHLPNNDYRVKMKADYGYIRGTEGEDGEEIDVYAGPDHESDKVFLVTQLTDEGEYDEDKYMLGYGSADEAEASYLDHMEEDKFGGIKEVSWSEFLKLVPRSQRSESKTEKTASSEKNKATVRGVSLADLLFLIEQGSPGVPAEIGKRLYKQWGAVHRTG